MKLRYLIIFLIIIAALPMAAQAEGVVEYNTVECTVNDVDELNRIFQFTTAGNYTIKLKTGVEIKEGSSANGGITLTVNKGQNIILDLNGGSIVSTALRNVFSIEVGGSLTIDDTSDKKAGYIAAYCQTASSTISKTSRAIYNNGTLIINNGEIKGGKLNSNNTANNKGLAIYNSGTFIMNGGSVTERSSDTSYDIYTYNGETTICGGTINADYNNKSTIVTGGSFKYDPFDSIEAGCKIDYASELYTVSKGLTGIYSIGTETYDSLSAAIKAASSTDTIKLEYDVRLAEADGISLTASQNVTVDLNGHRLLANSNANRFFTVSGKLTVKDSLGNGYISNTSSKAGTVFYINSSGTVTLDGGVIKDSSSDSNGGAVYVSGGSFIMNSGSIISCLSKGQYGGGAIYITKSGTKYGSATINGGAITGCSATQGNGGAIYVASNCSINLNGGRVADCSVISTKKGNLMYVGTDATAKFNGVILGSDDKPVYATGRINHDDIYYVGSSEDIRVLTNCYVVVTDSLTYNVRLSLTDNEETAITDATVNIEFIKTGTSTVIRSFENITAGENGLYEASYAGITAQYMAELFDVKVSYKLSDSDEQVDLTYSEQSIESYLNRISGITGYEDISRALLAYGNASTTYYNAAYSASVTAPEKIDGTSYSDITTGNAADNIIAKSAMTTTAAADYNIEGTSTARFKAARLRLGSKVTMIFTYAIQLDEAHKDAAVTVTSDKGSLGIPEKTGEQDGVATYTVELTGLTPLNYNDVYTLTLNVGGVEVQQLTYSVNTYCYNKQSTSGIEDLCRAIYQTGKAAEALEVS